MTKITNFSRGGRLFNRVIGKRPDGSPQTEQFLVLPGQTSEDVELADREDPVFVGMFERGEIGVDGKRGGELKEFDRLAADRAKHEEELAKFRKREAELATKEAELAAREDIVQKSLREAAMRAGATPGLADPLPPGTDTTGGEESKRALEDQGIDPAKAGKVPSSEGGPTAAQVREDAEKARASQEAKAKAAQESQARQQPQAPKK